MASSLTNPLVCSRHGDINYAAKKKKESERDKKERERKKASRERERVPP